MAKLNTMMLAFNRGLISALALARIDIKRTAMSAETFVNWMPRTLGSMMLRPGTKYINTSNGNVQAKYFPFVFSNNETALLELTDSSMRVIIDDVVITRVSVSTVILSPNFDTGGDWTSGDEEGTISEITSGLEMSGTGYNKASRTQTVAVSGADGGKEHVLTIPVTRGKITLKVGSTSGGEEYVNETVLLIGNHSIVFTPAAGNFYIEFFSRENFYSKLTSCNIAGAGDMVIPTPWSFSNLNDVRTAQSGDVVFVACKDVKQYRIERRSARGWSVVQYENVNPPLRTINLSKTKLTVTCNHTVDSPSSHTVTATDQLFTSDNADSTYKISIPHQYSNRLLGDNNQWTDSIAISGVGATQRNFDYTIKADTTAVGTLRVESSTDQLVWHKVSTTNAAVPGTTNVVDALDNEIVYYRVGFGPTGYTSGSVNVEVDYENGITEVLFVAEVYSTPTVLFGTIKSGYPVNGKKTADWEEGVWSAKRGYPTSVALFQGRLWWAGSDSIYGSESDNYISFNVDVLGDSGPIIRTIGQGPIDSIKWMAPSSTLILGGEISEYSVESGSGGPITGTDINIKRISTQGSTGVEGNLLDSSTVFVERSGSRIFQISQRENYLGVDIQDIALTIPEIGLPGIISIAIQRKPDTRIHCVRSDGTVAILVHDRAEDVTCWLNYETDGLVLDVAVLPSIFGDGEDQVYYAVKRNINGTDEYYLEKWALEADCQGETQNLQADCFLIYSGVSTATITGLSHLEGEQVVVWQDGHDAVDGSGDIKLFTVNTGQITLDAACTDAVVGLPYTAKFKSTKLAVSADLGVPINQTKIIDHLGLILYNAHFKGVTYGRDFDNQDDMPDTRGWEDQADGTIYATYDENAFEFSGSWNTDSRVCLEAHAPRPCTVLALSLSMSQHDR